jgi:hypothetical protein
LIFFQCWKYEFVDFSFLLGFSFHGGSVCLLILVVLL